MRYKVQKSVMIYSGECRVFDGVCVCVGGGVQPEKGEGAALG